TTTPLNTKIIHDFATLCLQADIKNRAARVPPDHFATLKRNYGKKPESPPVRRLSVGRSLSSGSRSSGFVSFGSFLLSLISGSSLSVSGLLVLRFRLGLFASSWFGARFSICASRVRIFVNSEVVTTYSSRSGKTASIFFFVDSIRSPVGGCVLNI